MHGKSCCCRLLKCSNFCMQVTCDASWNQLKICLSTILFQLKSFRYLCHTPSNGILSWRHDQFGIQMGNIFNHFLSRKEEFKRYSSSLLKKCNLNPKKEERQICLRTVRPCLTLILIESDLAPVCRSNCTSTFNSTITWRTLGSHIVS